MYIGHNSRTERPRKTKIGTDAANVTRDSDTPFKVKVTRPLWLVVLAGQHGYTVMVTYPYAYMTYIVSPLAGLGGGLAKTKSYCIQLLCELYAEGLQKSGISLCLKTGNPAVYFFKFKFHNLTVS